jgi:hypothetical protein
MCKTGASCRVAYTGGLHRRSTPEVYTGGAQANLPPLGVASFYPLQGQTVGLLAAKAAR